MYGQLTNNTGSGCTDPEVTLHEWDHSGALVRDCTFGAGEAAYKTTRTWSTRMVGIFFIDQPVEANVTSITGDVKCADIHP